VGLGARLCRLQLPCLAAGAFEGASPCSLATLKWDTIAAQRPPLMRSAILGVVQASSVVQQLRRHGGHVSRGTPALADSDARGWAPPGSVFAGQAARIRAYYPVRQPRCGLRYSPATFGRAALVLQLSGGNRREGLGWAGPAGVRLRGPVMFRVVASHIWGDGVATEQSGAVISAEHWGAVLHKAGISKIAGIPSGRVVTIQCVNTLSGTAAGTGSLQQRMLCSAGGVPRSGMGHACRLLGAHTTCF
jgi:hypothetical protein